MCVPKCSTCRNPLNPGQKGKCAGRSTSETTTISMELTNDDQARLM